MGANLSMKLSKLKGGSKKFITREVVEKIIQETQFKEDEVFLLIKRFELLKPEPITWSISINQLKKLAEFSNNPYTDLILHGIDVYKIIYDYLRSGNRKGYIDKEMYKIHAGITEQYEEKGKEYDDKPNVEEYVAEYQFSLFLEDEEYAPNKENVIDFFLFCIILNEFNSNKTFDQKFRLSFNIFDINKDQRVCFKDLKNFFDMIFKNYEMEKRLRHIDQYARKILYEFKDGDITYEIDFNNFQKILWDTNFISNLTIEP